MLVWLLVLLLLTGIAYVSYRFSLVNKKDTEVKKYDQHYTFKI